MDTIETILEVVFKIYMFLVNLLEPAIRALVEALFQTQVAPGGAQPVSMALVFLLALYGIRKLLANFLSSEANKPMKVVHTTDKTPAQVVAEDRQKKLFALLASGGVVYVLYLLGQVM